MSNLATLYSDAIKKHFKILYANWEPGGPIELGDYGVMEDNIFIPIGKLKDDFQEFSGDAIKVMPDPTKDMKEFKSETGVKVSTNDKGSLSPQGIELLKATLEISFSKKNAIYFNASGCTTTRISNKAKIGEKLKKLREKGKWEKKYCVVTEIVAAERAIIAISQSSDSCISFEADSPAIEKINLADTSIKLNLNTESNIGYKVPAQEGLILLLGFYEIKDRFLWKKEGLRQRAFRSKIKENSIPKEEALSKKMIFGKLGLK